MLSTDQEDKVPLRLPDVTLVCVETREYELARIAMQECLQRVQFGDVLLVTDQPAKFAGLGLNGHTHVVADFPDKLGWCKAMWYLVPGLIRTSHSLNIQWDSWVINTDHWHASYLDYDYIGAPWWYTDGKNVGNSGFCLKSKRLAQYVSDRRDKYPCIAAVEDDLLCRRYRPKLEENGFVWAPQKVAAEFAFECVPPDDPHAHFGFHAIFNWPLILSEDILMQRLNLAYQSEYIREGTIFKAFRERHPYLALELIKSPANQLKGVDDGEHFCVSPESVP